MYRVKTIPADLRHEETIIKAAQSLDSLQDTINSIFGRIDARISRNNDKVLELSARIQQAQSKILSLVGTKKAIKICAPSRYPSEHILCKIPATFPYSLQEKEMYFDEDAAAAAALKRSQPPLVKSKYEVPTPESIREKLVFYHVRTDEDETTECKTPLAVERRETNATSSTGLGRPPNNVRSTSSLLRFNSDEFVYSEIGNFAPGQESSDPNAWKRNNKQQEEARRVRLQQTQAVQNQKQQLPNAPRSLSHRRSRVRTLPSGDLRFTPATLDAPNFLQNAPIDLPDLPGIVNDIQHNPIDQLSPLLETTLPELTEAVDEHIISAAHPSADETIDSNIPEISNVTQTSRMDNCSIPLPPPPPPPPIPTDTTGVACSGLPGTIPPATITSRNFCPTSPSEETSLKVPTPPSDTRSDLMTAIRNAGGIDGGKLRSSRPTVTLNADVNNATSKETNSKSCGSGVGDLMADLHNKLLMRRKGISGSGKNSDTTSASGNPMLARLSSIIPPPVKRRSSKNVDNDQSDDPDNEEEWAD